MLGYLSSVCYEIGKITKKIDFHREYKGIDESWFMAILSGTCYFCAVIEQKVNQKLNSIQKKIFYAAKNLVFHSFYGYSCCLNKKKLHKDQSHQSDLEKLTKKILYSKIWFLKNAFKAINFIYGSFKPRFWRIHFDELFFLSEFETNTYIHTYLAYWLSGWQTLCAAISQFWWFCLCVCVCVTAAIVLWIRNDIAAKMSFACHTVCRAHPVWTNYLKKITDKEKKEKQSSKCRKRIQWNRKKRTTRLIWSSESKKI